MAAKFGKHLRSHYVAYAALFVALGGTAIALERGEVKSKHIAPNAVKGKQAKESTFKGLVFGKGKLVRKNADVAQGGFLPTPIPLVRVPTMGVVELIYCGSAGGQGNQMRVRLLSNDGASNFFGSNYVSASGLAAGTGKGEFVEHGGGVFSDGGGEPMIAQEGTGGVGLGLAAKWDFTLWRNSGSPRAAHVTVSGLNGLISGNRCRVSAQGEIFK